MRILLIEDAHRMAEAIEKILVYHNYAVDVRFDGQSGLDAALSGIYDVILLDIMLPVRDGISVLKELRACQVSTPLLLLTAKSQTEDRVEGLDAGADDYLAKPFEMAELLARIRALARRSPSMNTDGLRLAAGNIELDVGSLTLSGGGIGERRGKNAGDSPASSFTLTRKEALLMELLMRNIGIALSAQTIIERVWGFDAEAVESHIQVYISFLRKKLIALDSTVTIKTLRGHGYLLQVKQTGQTEQSAGQTEQSARQTEDPFSGKTVRG
jgi:DNA-binding response OmpR family regulator